MPLAWSFGAKTLERETEANHGALTKQRGGLGGLERPHPTYCTFLIKKNKTLSNCQNPQNSPTQKLNLNVYYGLQSIIMYRYQCTNCNKCTTLMQDINNRGNCVWGGMGIWNSMYHLLSYSVTLRLFCNSKTVPKKLSLLFKKGKPKEASRSPGSTRLNWYALT